MTNVVYLVKSKNDNDIFTEAFNYKTEAIKFAKENAHHRLYVEAVEYTNIEDGFGEQVEKGESEIVYDPELEECAGVSEPDEATIEKEDLTDDFSENISVPDCTRTGQDFADLLETLNDLDPDECECAWCSEVFDKSECRKEVDLGWLCPQCIAAIKSRGEELTFRENIQDEDEAPEEIHDLGNLYDGGEGVDL